MFGEVELVNRRKCIFKVGEDDRGVHKKLAFSRAEFNKISWYTSNSKVTSKKSEDEYKIEKL